MSGTEREPRASFERQRRARAGREGIAGSAELIEMRVASRRADQVITF